MGAQDERKAARGKVFRDSFLPGQGYDSLQGQAYKSLLEDEVRLMHTISSQFRGTGLTFNEIPERMPSLSIAAAYATVEAGGIIYDRPEFLYQMPDFPSLYRFLRAQELFNGRPRGGYALFVGSGLTIPEFLAQYLAPPSADTVNRYLTEGTQKAILQRFQDYVDLENQGAVKGSPVDLLEGIAMAIEPDFRQLSEIKKLNDKVQIPPQKIHIRPYTFGDVADAGEIPKGLTTIIWHRAEPGIVAGKDTEEMDIDYFREMLSIFYDHLVPGGTAVITVGGGNGPYEYGKRKEFLARTHYFAPTVGFRLNDQAPQFYEEGELSVPFGGLAAGIMGSVIAKKV